ncbi:hypothetical protein CIB93_24120 [Streptomyces sp. WZ.A104]|uniref:hypothetical protein n=1 Tax=Streptomyces sp. WZ.A104 TaxID=2023771 RepID=UPI000BBC375C|nr:hypothetical protein [Streptomyces sp. WZ.A104]PCG83555.1 hypothetical protein CIB93_24120 [Streptomyces sp. WZ.A104]
MQRTRITVQLLVGLAVTAVSGCVSVTPPAGPPGHPPPPGATGPAQDVAPQIVQPPAREALEVMVDPSPSASRPPAPTAPAASDARPAPGRAGPPPARERTHLPARTRPPRVPGVPHVVVPVPSVPRLPGSGGTDVCALGRGYGGWPAGSREARSCEEVYGR